MCNFIIIIFSVTPTIYDFLNIPNGARYSVISSNISIKGDPYALFSNPATIKANKRTISSNYIEYLAGIRGGSIVYLQKNVGIGISYLNYGEFEKLDEYGTKLGNFTPQSMLSVIGYSTPIGKGAIGINVKFIYEKISEYTSTGVATDIGYITRWQKLLVSASIQNLGTQIKKFNKEKEPLPTLAKIDISSFVFDSILQLVGSLYLPDREFSFGCEWKLTNIFDIRFGYYSLGKELATGGPLDIFAGLAFGFGFSVKKILLDYAIIPKCDLGIVHQISITPIL